MPTLENWSLCFSDENPFQAPETKTVRIQGQIFNDEAERFKDGTNIITSSIQSFDFINMTIKTYNTEYKLGRISLTYLTYLECLNTIDLNTNMIINHYTKALQDYKVNEYVEIKSWKDMLVSGKASGFPQDSKNPEFVKVVFEDDSEFYEYQQYLCGRQFKIEEIEKEGKITIVKLLEDVFNDDDGVIAISTKMIKRPSAIDLNKLIE